MIHVHPLSEVRKRLSGIVARFRRVGLAAEPVAFGSHRKPEAILLLGEVNALHPVREGNGRTQRAFFGQPARGARCRSASVTSCTGPSATVVSSHAPFRVQVVPWQAGQAAIWDGRLAAMCWPRLAGHGEAFSQLAMTI